MFRVRRELKAMHEFIIIMLIIFGLCFAVSTLGYNASDPSLSEKRVIRYGFPITWLKTTTQLVDSSPTQYTVLWAELFVDIIFYVALSSVISFIILKAKRQPESLKKVP